MTSANMVVEQCILSAIYNGWIVPLLDYAFAVKNHWKHHILRVGMIGAMNMMGILQLLAGRPKNFSGLITYFECM